MDGPHKLTPEVQARLVTAVAAGATWQLAAQAAGIGERTLRRWRQAGEEAEEGAEYELVQAIKAAEAEAAIGALSKIKAAWESGEWAAAGWYLERRHGYVRRSEVSGPDGGAIDLATASAADQATVRDLLENPKARDHILAALEAIDEEDVGGGEPG